MSDQIKITPDEIKKSMRQVGHDLAGIESTMGNIKYEIIENTGKSVIDFSVQIAEFTSRMNTYTGKFKENLAALGRATDLVYAMDKSLKEAVAGKSTSSVAAAKELEANGGTVVKVRRVRIPKLPKK